MSFNPANLTVVIPQSFPGNAVAKYTTTDTISTTLGSGYFSAALPGLRVGDSIVIEASNATWLCLVVAADDSGGVGVINAIQL